MRQVLFGGSFDPPHLGHSRVIRALANSYEKLIVIPSGPHLFKQQATALDDRRGLIESWLSGFDELSIDVDWSQLNSNSRCYDLLEKYCIEGGIMSFCIGEDLLEQLPDWYRSEELKTRVCFVVIPRETRIENHKTFEPQSQIAREALESESFESTEVDSDLLRIGLKVDRLSSKSQTLIKQLVNNGFQFELLEGFEPVSVSSSRIREKILNSDERCQDLLDPIVWKYIQSRNIYSS